MNSNVDLLKYYIFGTQSTRQDYYVENVLEELDTEREVRQKGARGET